jgi:hypothetical protein
MFRKHGLSLSFYATHTRLFSISARNQSNRAIVYSQHGQPADVVRALTTPSLPAPPPQTVNVRFILSPINPADVNVIEGVYPVKPQPLTFPGVEGGAVMFVGGNEGLAEVTRVGEGVEGLGRGDWVVMRASQVGTWRSAANVREAHLLKVPRLRGLSEVNAATMMVRAFFAACYPSPPLKPSPLIVFEHRSTPRVHTAFCRTLSLWRAVSGSFKTARIARCVTSHWDHDG